MKRPLKTKLMKWLLWILTSLIVSTAIWMLNPLVVSRVQQWIYFFWILNPLGLFLERRASSVFDFSTRCILETTSRFNIQISNLEGYASLDLTVVPAVLMRPASIKCLKTKITRFEEHILISSCVYDHRFYLFPMTATTHQLQTQGVSTFFANLH